MRLLHRTAGLLVAAGLALTACSTGGDVVRVPTPSDSTSSPSTLGSGFYNPASPPPPEGTVTPSPGSWGGAKPPAGYRVVLLTAGTDAPTRALVTAITAWAREQGVRLTTVQAPHDKLVANIATAVDLAPDLIISAGNDLIDPLAVVTASNLHQQFLVVGGELAEPTSNVTAADWTGAAFRGEGLGTPSAYEPASFTPERIGRAVRAGVAAVLNHLTGIVVWVS